MSSGVIVQGRKLLRASAGQQDQELVAKRSRCDLAYDRQFALGGEPDNVTRRDCCIVDDHTSRLCPGLGSLASHIVKRCCCHFAIAAISSKRAISPMLMDIPLVLSIHYIACDQLLGS